MFGVIRSSRFLNILLAVFFFAASFIVGRDLVAAEQLGTVLIRDVLHVRQKPDFCGEACAEMWLRKRNVLVDQDYVFDQSGLDPTLGRGCYTKELAQALKRIGFRIGDVCASIPVRTASFRNNAAADPTGYKTLKTVLDEDDMADFQKRWEAYVLKLEFR